MSTFTLTDLKLTAALIFGPIVALVGLLVACAFLFLVWFGLHNAWHQRGLDFHHRESMQPCVHSCQIRADECVQECRRRALAGKRALGGPHDSERTQDSEGKKLV